jgi:DNA invertase Pin-like site-specific DNA recombinase
VRQSRRKSTSTSIYVDDGISGAEFVNRLGFLRLMNALKARPPFQVLIISEESRLGREAIETAYVLKQLVTVGVRVFFYMENRERTAGLPHRQDHAVADRVRRRTRAREGAAADLRCDAPQGKGGARHVQHRRPILSEHVPPLVRSQHFPTVLKCAGYATGCPGRAGVTTA